MKIMSINTFTEQKYFNRFIKNDSENKENKLINKPKNNIKNKFIDDEIPFYEFYKIFS